MTTKENQPGTGTPAGGWEPVMVEQSLAIGLLLAIANSLFRAERHGIHARLWLPVSPPAQGMNSEQLLDWLEKTLSCTPTQMLSMLFGKGNYLCFGVELSPTNGLELLRALHVGMTPTTGVQSTTE